MFCLIKYYPEDKLELKTEQSEHEENVIVVGDLSLKMAGNSTSIKGEYFEIVYVEEGIVNIENRIFLAIFVLAIMLGCSKEPTFEEIIEERINLDVREILKERSTDKAINYILPCKTG